MSSPQFLRPSQPPSGASSPAPSGSSASSHYGFERYPSSPSRTSASSHSPYPSPQDKHRADVAYFEQNMERRYPQPQASQAPYPTHRAAPGGFGAAGGPVFTNQHLQPHASSRAPPPPAPVFVQPPRPAQPLQRLPQHVQQQLYHQNQQQQLLHQRADSDEVEQLRPTKPTWQPRTSSRPVDAHGAQAQMQGGGPAYGASLRPQPLASPTLSSYSGHSASTTFTFPAQAPSLPPTPGSSSFPRGEQGSPHARAGNSAPRSPQPAPAGLALGPPFDPADWTSPSLPDVVSPSLYLAWQASPLAKRQQFETVFVDAQMRRVVFVAREYRRGRDGVLRREDEGGAAAEDGILWPEWHDGLGAAEGAEAGQARNDAEGVEWLLLEVPTAKQRERGSDQLKKVGLVTEESLFLQQAKKTSWSKFYRRAIFGNGEPTWKGVGGGKYRWAKLKDPNCYKLVDDKTKEVVVTVREQDNKPTQLILSALILPSIQPVILTLLHRSYAIAKKARASDQRVWEEEEVVAW